MREANISDNSDREVSVDLQLYLEREISDRDYLDSVKPETFLNMLMSLEKDIPLSQDYLNRIAQVAYERYKARNIEQDIPPLAILPDSVTAKEVRKILGDRINYALVFGAESVYFQDTVHALSVDSRGLDGPNILGVHTDWLSADGQRFRRAMLVDETGSVIEMAFQRPVAINVVQILHLPLKNEMQIHRKLSRLFQNNGILQINPYHGGSERGDDKSWSHELWSQHRSEIPRYVLIPRGSSSEQILDLLGNFIGQIKVSSVVVQPNKGTEGRKVKKFDNISQLCGPVVKYIENQILPEDDAIIREKRGNVRYKAPSDFPVNITFRINVAWNGWEFVAESGYAQIAKDKDTFPASRGRDGKIIGINDAFNCLYYQKGGEWIRLILADADIEAIKMAAVKAATSLNSGLKIEDYLKHLGVDIILEVKENDIIPVVLEANSRPAGLSYSCEIVGISAKKPRLGISSEIFRFLELNMVKSKNE